MGKDIVQVDDIVCTNTQHLPIVNMLFMDEDGCSQLLAFGVLSSRTTEAFTVFLDDVKLRAGSPKMIICDRFRAQIRAVQKAMPDSPTCLCRVHLKRNIYRIFGLRDNPIVPLYDRFMSGMMTREHSSCFAPDLILLTWIAQS